MSKYKIGNYPNSPLTELALGIPNFPVRVLKDQWVKLYCSFCGKETSEVACTRGTGQVTVSNHTELYRDHDNNVQVSEKIIYSSRKVVACPNCAHKVVTTKFPSLE